VRRREFITLISGAAAAWPLVARAQRDRPRLIGLLWGIAADDPERQRRFSAFAGGLQEAGWIEGKNVTFAARHAVGPPDRFSTMAAELVQMNPDAIVVSSAGLASIARQATATIPIVTVTAGELEGTGLIASLRRPGGNVTGIQILAPDLMSKRVELLKELVPQLTRLAVLVPVTPAGINTPRYMERIVEAARALRIQTLQFEGRSPNELAAAVGAMTPECQAGIVIANPLAASNAALIADAFERHRLPAMYEFRFYALAGGLLSYGSDNISLHRQAATFVDKILRGANPGDLPVQQPTKFELVINLKSARQLGLVVPDKLLALADEVIE
jgi:putative ABC transport system substrate-binding protein